MVIVKKGINIDDKDMNGNTAAHLAAAGGFLIVIEFLKDSDACFIITNKRGLIPMHAAIVGDNIETYMVCKYAAENQLDISKLTGMDRKIYVRNPSLAHRTKTKLTPLMLSIINNCEKIFYHLIECEVYLDDQDDRGYTALHHAIVKKDALKARILIQYGADTKVMTYKHQTAYDMATQKQLKMVTF